MAAHHISTAGSPSGSANINRNRQALPPIRTVLGEHLSLPSFASSHSPHSASSRGSPRDSREYEGWHGLKPSNVEHSSSLAVHDQRHRSRLRASTISSHSHSTHSPHEPPTPSFSPSAYSLPPSPFRLTPPSPPGHLPAPPAPPHSSPPSFYNVLRPSPSGGLITAAPVSRARKSANSKSHSRSAPNTTPQSEERRHVCPTCQKRFSRPSSLRTHQSVHTGSRPYACLHQGCPKMFSVASNMRRHMRKHTTSGTTDTPDQATRADAPDLDYLGSSSEGDADVEMETEEEIVIRPSFGNSTYFEWSSTPGSV